jgi:TetR/AcrR family transcriptional repressor of nem operon
MTNLRNNPSSWSLTRYLDGSHEQIRASLSEAPTPLDGLRAWMSNVVFMRGDQSMQRGCMAMNSAVELGRDDAQVRGLLESQHSRMSRLLIEIIEQAQQQSQVRSDLSAEKLAKTLFVFVAGLLGTSKMLRDTVDTEEMVEAALQMVAPV